MPFLLLICYAFICVYGVFGCGKFELELLSVVLFLFSADLESLSVVLFLLAADFSNHNKTILKWSSFSLLHTESCFFTFTNSIVLDKGSTLIKDAQLFDGYF